MANTLDANLIVDILAEQAMNTLPSALSPLRAFSTDFSATRAEGPRQTIQVELVKTAGSALVNPTNFEQTATENQAVAVVSNHLSRPVGLSAQDLNEGRRLRTKATKAAESIANAVLDTCMGLVTASNYAGVVYPSSTGTAPAPIVPAYDKAMLRRLWAAISNGRQKNAVLSGEVYSEFLPSNLEAFDPTKTKVGIFGFDNFDYNNRFAAAGSGVVGFSCDPSAMAVAARLPADPGSAKENDYIASDVVSIDSLGISIEFNVWFSRATRGHWLSYDVVFGAAVGDNTALHRLVDTLPSSS
jgi:hypothetical protein